MPNQNDFKIIPTQILESVPSAILITDKETTEIVDVNTNFELLSGFSKQELIGNRTKDLNLWVDWNMRERMVGQLRENSHFTGVPMQLRKKSNQIIIAMCSGSYFQTNGKDYFMLYLLALADNEELKERVSVSEQNFKILFEKSPILMAISELTSGRFIECNEAFNKVTEFEREEIIGKNVFELNLWDNPDDRRRIMEGVSHDLKFMEEKFRFWSKNRKELWGLCSFTRIQYGGVDCLLASIKDITESKMIEDRNQFQEAIVTYLFDNISDPIFAKDVNGRILLCNEAMSQMIGGYHKSQVIGKLQSDLVFGDTLKELIQDDQKVYERDDTVESEIRFVKGSSTHYMLSKKSPWHDSEGNLKGLIGLARDITKHKDLELELRYKIDRKDKLFRILAHDLRGPMGSVSQLLELIIEKIPEDSDIAELLTMAYRSSNQTFNLLENLLGWIQGQLSENSLRFAEVSLREVIALVFGWLESQATNKNIKLFATLLEDITIECEPKVLETILRNLVSNALKYSSSGGSVEIRAIDLEDGVKIEVIDTGCGMNANKMNRIFHSERVDSAKGTDGEQGNGLGLMFCGDLVKSLSGKIDVKSEVGKGTTFTLILPKKADKNLRNL